MISSFLQFGSPHGLGSQSQYVSAERSEIWVNIGYRLSAFGFLACDQPKVDGNFGFKDQWLALKWIKDNIKVFGGMWMIYRCRCPLTLVKVILTTFRLPGSLQVY